MDDRIQKEVYRYNVIQSVLSKELTQIRAAEMLKISVRQIRKIQTRVKTDGRKGVISRHVGKPGTHKKSGALKQKVLALVREKYEDCGPTFIKEKLADWHDINISEETIRLWMIVANLWKPRTKKKKIHLLRPRRECFGELIQADGSEHHWFGENLPKATAISLIDDATSTLTAVFFCEEETTDGYYKAIEQHLKKYGIPLGLYTDRFSVFKTPKGNGTTQMQRALKELGIELTLAYSPQAKGRVERLNRILQDRLVKEFRLRGIKTIEQANAFMPEYIQMHNKLFSKKPKSNFNAHRPLEGFDLERILSHHETRTLLSSCTFQFNNKFFVVQNISEIRRSEGKKVDIYISKGRMRVFMDKQELQVKLLEECCCQSSLDELSGKEVTLKHLRGRGPKKPQPCSHPWKRFGFQIALANEIKQKEKEKQLNDVRYI